MSTKFVTKIQYISKEANYGHFIDFSVGVLDFALRYSLAQEQTQGGFGGAVRFDRMHDHNLLCGLFLLWNMHHTEFHLAVVDLNYAFTFLIINLSLLSNS